MHNQERLNEWYRIKPQMRDPEFTSGFYWSGRRLAEKVKEGQWLLDVGCATNPFKKLLPNVTGLDPANEYADVHCTIEDFEPDRLYDVAFVLGSINFGTEDIIARQIEKVVQCITPEASIYWRLQPYLPHPPKKDGEEDFLICFPWTFEKLREFADKYGFIQTEEHEDYNKNAKHDFVRLYAEWHRP